MNGKWDEFPALEIFIEDLEKNKVDLMHFENTTDAGSDLRDRKDPINIFNLFDRQGDININKSGQS